MGILSKTLAPGIVVYRSGIEDLDSAIGLVETALNNPSPENKIFSPPGRSGAEDSRIFLAHISGDMLDSIGKKSSSSFDYELPIKLQNIFYDFFEDYLVKSKETRMLMPYIDHEKVIRGNDNWAKPHMSLLKHEKITGREPGITNEEEPWSNRLGWHTDSVSDSSGPGMKHSVTANLYLNDNYEGGMINFLYGNTIDNIYDTDNLKIVSYKPLAGDMILYPSMWPVAHSVSYSGIEDRYLISTILRYHYDGSMGEELDRFVMPYSTPLRELAETVKESEIRYVDGKDFWGV